MIIYTTSKGNEIKVKINSKQKITHLEVNQEIILDEETYKFNTMCYLAKDKLVLGEPLLCKEKFGIKEIFYIEINEELKQLHEQQQKIIIDEMMKDVEHKAKLRQIREEGYTQEKHFFDINELG